MSSSTGQKCFKITGLFAFCSVAFILFLPGHIYPNKSLIRYFSYPDYTRIVVELKDGVVYSIGKLSDPERIFIDIDRELKGIQRELKIKDSIIESIRTGFPKRNLTRIVIDLNQKADYMIFPLYEPFRIVIDIIAKNDKFRRSSIPLSLESRSVPPEGQPIQKDQPTPSQENKYQNISVKKARIVLDPGHGGHDPGAIGKKGLMEKDVNLDIALRVREILKEDFEIFMTREKDIFISLEERTAFTNSKKADLFVSIHTNSNRKKNINGIETYFLNWTDDEEALRVAARENGISLKAMKNFANYIDLIKMDLEAQAKRDDSMILATAIYTEIKNNIQRPSNEIKKGPFYVLYTAKMPCVLVEVSYISNPEEEMLLKKSSYRKALAKAIANGIKRYFELRNRKDTAFFKTSFHTAETRKS